MDPAAIAFTVPLLHVQEHGRGGTPLVLLHGLAGAGSSWSLVVPELARDRRVLLPDLLGFGRSPWPDVAYTVDDHLAAIERLLTERGIGNGPFDLAGHSMGAVLAAELAARGPNRVRGLALVSLPLFRSADAVRVHAAGMGPLARLTVTGHWIAGALCATMCALRPVLTFLAPHFAPHVPADVARDALRHNFASYSRSLRSVIVRHRPDAALRALSDRPVLFLHGDADRSAPLAPVRELVEHARGWRLRVVPGANHYLPIERPRLVAAGLREVLSAPARC